MMHVLCLAAAVVLSAALTPPQLLVASTSEVLLTAPPKSVDSDGALASRLATLTNASAFVVDPTLHEPAPLGLPTIELFVADDTTRREIDSRRAARVYFSSGRIVCNEELDGRKSEWCWLVQRRVDNKRARIRKRRQATRKRAVRIHRFRRRCQQHFTCACNQELWWGEGCAQHDGCS